MDMRGPIRTLRVHGSRNDLAPLRLRAVYDIGPSPYLYVRTRHSGTALLVRLFGLWKGTAGPENARTSCRSLHHEMKMPGAYGASGYFVDLG